MIDSDHPGTLKRLLGLPSMIAVGAGVAIGSGIFRVPGDIAGELQSTGMILLAWFVAGFITMIQSLVNAELATRYPEAGGEYQYLKYAYGNFAAFIFGWCCTVFISGAGIGAIAAALGDFGATLADQPNWSRPIGASAIVLVVGVNCLGLRSGAVAQNILTALKVLALIGITVGAIWYCGRATPAPAESSGPLRPTTLGGFSMATLFAFWCYTGATDSVRLAGEVHDTRRALPRALIGTTLLLTFVYVAYNYALLCAAPAAAMAGRHDAHTLAFAGSPLPIREVILIASIVVCLGAISAAALANSRVLFAMGRDGLAFRQLARMTRRQAPVPALLTIGLFALVFVWNRSFEQIVRVYFLGSAILFAMVYFSLLVFRRRERRSTDHDHAGVYRLPAPTLWVGLLLAFEGALAANCIRESPVDSLATVLAFLVTAGIYWIAPLNARSPRT